MAFFCTYFAKWEVIGQYRWYSEYKGTRSTRVEKSEDAWTLFVF